MNAIEGADRAVLKRIVRRVDGILKEARERQRRGQMLALDIDARFRLEDRDAVQFQLASAILEEMGGMREEEVVCELFSLGLAAVLRCAAEAAQDGCRSLRVDDEALLRALRDPIPGAEGPQASRTIH
jgi:hypothetical protein